MVHSRFILVSNTPPPRPSSSQTVLFPSPDPTPTSTSTHSPSTRLPAGPKYFTRPTSPSPPLGRPQHNLLRRTILRHHPPPRSSTSSLNTAAQSATCPCLPRVHETRDEHGPALPPAEQHLHRQPGHVHRPAHRLDASESETAHAGAAGLAVCGCGWHPELGRHGHCRAWERN